MDMRYMRGMDGRRLPPRNARGEFRRRRRGDRGMDYGDMRNDYNYDMARQNDMRNNYARQGGMDGHYPQGQGSTYYPIQAMGTFEGYYGMPEQDYGYDMRNTGRGRDYGYDMRGDYARGGRRDYGYNDYGYDYGDYGDYGETLSEEELEHWNKKLLKEFDEREKQMFNKDAIMQKAKNIGRQMKDFGEKELYTATLMCYSDFKQSIGANPDLAVKLAYDWLSDKDVAVKGAQKLAVYHDCIVEGEDD